MTKGTGVIRLCASGDVENGMSPWIAMPLVGDVLDGQPEERFHRVFDTIIQSPTEVRAGVWEATAYSEKLTNYPYNEIVFLLEGSMSIIDSDGIEERFDPGDCFFLNKGFNGIWKQHDTIKIFHMTVDPKQE
jgi:uncharacterized cupin superfamily protein